MHVALNGWFWDQPFTGSGQYVRRLTAALRKVAPDLKITLVLPADANADDLPAGVTALTTRGSRSNIGKVWFEQRTFPAAVAQVQADIAHVPYWGAPLSSPARLITSVLDVIPLALPEYASGFGARLYTALVSATARGSAHILTLSAASKADIVTHLGIAPEVITVTHLAADEAFHPSIGAEHDEDIRLIYDLPDQFVLYISGFDPRKNLKALLAAYTYVASAEGDAIPLVIAGREPQWGTPMFPDLRAYADEIGVSDAIRWIGAVDEVDKPALMRLADVVAVPSTYEGFGLPVIEALASGTPVVAAQIPVMEEIVGDAAYLVPPDDARKLAGALLALLGQNPLRQTQITRGLAQATKFNWRKTARETYAVYEHVMAL